MPPRSTAIKDVLSPWNMFYCHRTCSIDHSTCSMAIEHLPVTILHVLCPPNMSYGHTTCSMAIELRGINLHIRASCFTWISSSKYLSEAAPIFILVTYSVNSRHRLYTQHIHYGKLEPVYKVCIYAHARATLTTHLQYISSTIHEASPIFTVASVGMSSNT